LDSQFISVADISHMMMLDNKWYNVAQALEGAITKKWKRKATGEEDDSEGENDDEEEEVIRFTNSDRE
jgi:hypothetical protein